MPGLLVDTDGIHCCCEPEPLETTEGDEEVTEPETT